MNPLKGNAYNLYHVEKRYAETIFTDFRFGAQFT